MLLINGGNIWGWNGDKKTIEKRMGITIQLFIINSDNCSHCYNA